MDPQRDAHPFKRVMFCNGPAEAIFGSSIVGARKPAIPVNSASA